MAYTKKLKFLLDEPHSIVWVPPASAAVIEEGMIVKMASGEVTQIDAAIDCKTVFGVANGRSAAGETDEIPVVTEGYFRAPVVSATYTWGAGLKYDVGVDNGTLIADGDADTIAWTWQHAGSAVTSLKIYFNLKLLSGKLWDANSAASA